MKAPTRVLVRPVMQKGGCWGGRGADEVRCACRRALLHLPALVSSRHPAHHQFSMSCCRAERPSVNTAQAPPTEPLKKLRSFIHRPPPFTPSSSINNTVINVCTGRARLRGDTRIHKGSDGERNLSHTGFFYLRDIYHRLFHVR